MFQLCLTKYSELLHVLSDIDSKPSAAQDIAVELETVFLNIVYVVNQLRKSQARQRLMDMIKLQIKSRKDTAAKLIYQIYKQSKEIETSIASSVATFNINNFEKEKSSDTNVDDMEVDDGNIHELKHSVSAGNQHHFIDPINIFNLL